MHKISKKEINAAKIHIILSKQDTPSKNDVKIFYGASDSGYCNYKKASIKVDYKMLEIATKIH